MSVKVAKTLFRAAIPHTSHPFQPALPYLENKLHCHLNYEFDWKLHGIEGLEIFRGSPLVLVQF